MIRRFPKLLPHLLRLTLAGAFLAAGGGDAFGAHACPHHDGPGGHPTEEQPHGEERSHGSDAHHPEHGSEAHAGSPHQDSSHDGPCTCVGDCQGGASAPLSIEGPAPVDLAPASVANHGFSRTDRPLGPRVRLYQLHLPNAPPVAR